MGIHIDEKKFKSLLEGKLSRHFGKSIKDASNEQFYVACSFILRDILMENWAKTEKNIQDNELKQVYYLSMEFLIGKSLHNNINNLGLNDVFNNVFSEIGVSLDDIMAIERDAGLGNGGLGRLAACYMDSLTALGYPGMGFSILYEYGIFKQKIIDGMQVELPDNWLETGSVWTVPRIEETQEVRFEGKVDSYMENGELKFSHHDYYTVLAVPNDMLISGYPGDNVNTLRLWSAKSTKTIDMQLFSRGEYAKSMEQKAMSEVISKVLYPEDNHYEGKSLRLKQQYFFVSATIQSIVKKHKAQYGTMSNFADKAVIHINDTHPTLAIPELMRILIDEEGFGWDESWRIVSNCMAYTNHTIMAEALERWTISMFKHLLPRIYMIVEEINRRFCEDLWNVFPEDREKIGRLAIIANDEIRMANLCIATCYSVNGVSALHSDILKNLVFSDYNHMFPTKFTNVTNGIAHRRWLCQSNPELTKLLDELIGEGFRSDANELTKLLKFADDATVLKRLAEIKKHNKERFVKHLGTEVAINPDSIFDVQSKRLHEYKRQLLNVLHILYEYHMLLDNPNMDFTPKTYFFGAKSAAGYAMAKNIIRLINSVASEINSNAVVNDKLKVFFVEDYNVSMAEVMIPAAEISEQISIAGKEASGTGNMKFMLNGALTIGTLDGANVEICESVGEENIYIFGLKAHEVETIVKAGNYSPLEYYHNNPKLRRVIDHIRDGIGVGVLRNAYPEIVNSLLFRDQYMLLADFDSYCNAHDKIYKEYNDKSLFNRKSLINIANAGRFAADRSISEYADNIWHIKKVNNK
ncbi:MAG: glycogen/starch/alpha-glucan phosphorylase [Ruminococcaceae bacterium]|nr:glycogen/starch/alpha-glucan phosphorylase [Oscillospiraceae bacterium]